MFNIIGIIFVFSIGCLVTYLAVTNPEIANIIGSQVVNFGEFISDLNANESVN